jgi:hypothetical protein
MRYLIVPLLAAAAVACGQGSNPTSLTGPTSVGSTRLIGDLRNSCPSDVPGGFHITSGEQVGTRWKNLVQFEPVANTPQYYVELQRRSTNAGPVVPYGSWALTASDGVSIAYFEQYDLPEGVYRARIRSFCGATPQGNWSDWVEFVNGDGPFGYSEPPSIPVDPCAAHMLARMTAPPPDPCAPPEED